LAPTGQISRQVNSASETHYYSNVGMITIVTKGADTVTITVPVLSLEKLGLLTGQTVDPTTGALITGELEETYFALIYRIQLTDNSWRYVVKYKAQLSQPPEEVSQTRSDGVNTNNQQLVFTCNKTIYEFENGGHADGLEVDERDNLCDFDSFFTTVYTPDTIDTIAKAEVTALSVTPSQLTAQVVGTSDTVSVSVTPSGTPVRWASSNPSVASVEPYSATGARVTMNSLGSAVITATSGSRSDSCAVTVTTESNEEP
ncbi:MAG: Ig-like domain-containing protein, partial [Ruminococcus sp.]|nr:Ig-like domain-containing protein [Ruminococcus sp.]